MSPGPGISKTDEGRRLTRVTKTDERLTRVKSFKLTNGSGLRLKVYYFDPAIDNAVFWSGISWLDSSALIGRLPMARRGEEVVKMKDTTLNALLERYDPQRFAKDRIGNAQCLNSSRLPILRILRRLA